MHLVLNYLILNYICLPLCVCVCVSLSYVCVYMCMEVPAEAKRGCVSDATPGVELWGCELPEDPRKGMGSLASTACIFTVRSSFQPSSSSPQFHFLTKIETVLYLSDQDNILKCPGLVGPDLSVSSLCSSDTLGLETLGFYCSLDLKCPLHVWTAWFPGDGVLERD